MALDIRTIAEQIQNIYLGGRPTVEGIDVRDIELLVRQALDTVITEDYFNNYKFENQSESNSAFLVPFDDLPVVNGKVFLPEKGVNLPKDRAISGVYKGKNYSEKLTYTTLGQYANLKNGGLLKFANKFYYYRLADNLHIVGACEADRIPFDKVRVVMTVANDVTVDDGMAMLIIARVLPIVERYRKPDMKNDQNPTVI